MEHEGDRPAQRVIDVELGQLLAPVLQRSHGLRHRVMDESGDHELHLLLLHGHPVFVVQAVEHAGGGLGGPEDLVGVLQRQVAVGADHPGRALGAGFAQIGAAGTVGDHQGHHERRAAQLVAGVQVDRLGIDKEGEHRRHDAGAGDLDVAADGRGRSLHQPRQSHADHDHRDHQQRVRAVKEQGDADQHPHRRLLPAGEVGPVEQQEGGADHQDAGEDVRHGEAGHPGQAGSERKGRHQGVVGPTRRL